MTAHGGLPVPGLAWSLAIVLVDQLTKALVVQQLPLHASVTVIPGLLDFAHVRNTGAAFGLLNDADFPLKTLLIVLVAFAAMVGIAWYAAQLPREHRVAHAGLLLILGGAVGNLIDRVRQGYVVDFVDVYWRSYHFWAFNVADAAITVGVVLLLIDLVRGEQPRREEASPDVPSAF